VLLRRTKGSKIDGKPIVDLPPREVAHARLAFPPAEREHYNRLQAQSMAELKVWTLSQPSAVLSQRQAETGAGLMHGLHDSMHSLGAGVQC
jgi:hypothetical protein